MEVRRSFKNNDRKKARLVVGLHFILELDEKSITKPELLQTIMEHVTHFGKMIFYKYVNIS